MKTLILMQGIPGSGKSTVARQYARALPGGCQIYSTDEFWGASYKFVPELLGRAHEWNQLRAATAMAAGCDTVIIDNTNIKRSHVQPYLDMAHEHGYDVQVIRVSVDPKLAFERGTHGVPMETVQRMHDEMEDLI